MTPKERMLTALARQKPDRLPATIHQWQAYHLETEMGGVDALEAFKICGLDAQIQYFSAPKYVVPAIKRSLVSTPQWQETYKIISSDPDNRLVEHTVITPKGNLTYKTGGNRITTWIVEPMVKSHADVELIDKYMPIQKWDPRLIEKEYDRVGDAGILRGTVWGNQPGCWQHACYLMGEQELIFEAMDDPEFVHYFLKTLLKKKLQFIEESIGPAKFDIVETGGGASSDTLISPAMHREFCLPYDKIIHDALHAVGHRATYHTCGGMMFILDQILQNGCDASETLSPPGTGGNITEPEKVRQVFGGKIAMIGGLDQFNILGKGTPAQIEAETQRLFEGFGKDGGYICSASDHFFEAPAANLKAFAEAAKHCVY